MSSLEKKNGCTLKPKIVYQPHYKETQLVRFTNFVENKYNIKLKNYWELYEWSCKNYPEFWECIWIFFDILYSTPYIQVFEGKGFLDAKWFGGVRFNYTANILKYRDSRTALIGIDAKDNIEYVTYSELYDEVKVYIKAFKDAGIGKGDVVACYMSNKIEAVFAFLATAAIGALFSGCLPLLGAKGTLSRFQQINPKILLTAGDFFWGSTEIRMDLKLPEIVSGLTSLEKVIFVPSKTKGKAEDTSRIPKCVLLSEFLQKARTALKDDSNDIEFEQLPFDHPLCISFTSGTTGAPKCVVHSVGMFLSSLRDYGLSQDCTRKDVLFHMLPVGWVVWHTVINTLHLGLAVIMYEGNAFLDTPTRFWDLVDQHGITSTFIGSHGAEIMEIMGHVPTVQHSLKTLKQLFGVGSVMKPQTFTFLTEKVKRNIFCSSAYGCTETAGLLCGFDSNLPVYRGEIQVFALGMDVRVLDENGSPVVCQRGDLVIANPHPGSPIGLFNDENHAIMKDQYLSKHPGYWNIGDEGWINSVTKGFVVYGRSDDSMNPRGSRFNCSDIYFALEEFPGLVDSVCVSQFNSSMEERVVLFVQMEPGCPLNDQVRDEIRRTIEHHMTIGYVPDIIIEAPDMPYTLIGKKLNGLVKKLINKRPITDTDNVANPTSLDFYKTVELGEF